MIKNILLVSMLVFSMVICSCAKETEEERDFILMGTSNIFPPFTYADASGQHIGFDIEIGKIVAQKMNKQLVITNMSFAELIPAVQNGLIDISICATTITEERKRIIDYSVAYYETSQIVIILKDNELEFVDIKTKDELGQNKKLAAEGSSIGAAIAKTLAGGRMILEGTFDEILPALQREEVDAIIMDGDVAKATLRRYPDMMLLPINFDVEEYGIVIQKDNTKLLSSVNRTLTELRASGEYDRLKEQYIDRFLRQ